MVSVYFKFDNVLFTDDPNDERLARVLTKNPRITDFKELSELMRLPIEPLNRITLRIGDEQINVYSPTLEYRAFLDAIPGYSALKCYREFKSEFKYIKWVQGKIDERKAVDHLGQEFPTFEELCEHHQIRPSTLNRALANGMDMTEAIQKLQKPKDHLGNIFPSHAAMCRHYGLSIVVYRYRRYNQGWSLEDTLTTPSRHRTSPYETKPLSYRGGSAHQASDHLGNKYPSISKMCEAYGISPSAYNSRLNNGWSKGDALTKPVESTTHKRRTKPVEDHIGRTYPSITDMCEDYGILPVTYRNRITRGWSVEQALTTPTDMIISRAVPCEDHLGNKYRTKKDMCLAYGIDTTVFNYRMKSGWGLERALTQPLQNQDA